MSLIVIEGSGEGCGKSTQARMLVDRMSDSGYTAWLQRFPDRTSPTGKLIDAHLQGKWQARGERFTDFEANADYRCLDALVFQALQLANRAEISARMEKQVREGVLVTDRYWMSGYAYGIADGLDGNYLKTLHECLPKPDLAILVDCPVEVSKSRLLARGGKLETYEARGPEFHEKLRADYLTLWSEGMKARRLSGASRTYWVVVDGSLDADAVHREIVDHVMSLGLHREIHT